MSDSLQYYIKEGFLYGTFHKEEFPWKDVKTSPLKIRVKPDGSVRLLIARRKLGDGMKMSLNATIGDDLVVDMTSITKQTEVLQRAECL